MAYSHCEFQDRMKHWIALAVKSAESENFDEEQFLEDLFDESEELCYLYMEALRNGDRKKCKKSCIGISSK